MDTTKYRTQIPVKKDGIFAYEIYLEKDFGMLAERLKVCKPENRRLCIVTDSTVDQYYGDQVEEILASCAKEVTRFVFRAGEENKNLNTVQDLYEHLILHHFERKDMLVALGGGVVGDLPVSLQRLIFEALILFKFRQHCSHRWTAALAVRQAWTLTVIKIWSEPFISQNWCI